MNKAILILNHPIRNAYQSIVLRFLLTKTHSTVDQESLFSHIVHRTLANPNFESIQSDDGEPFESRRGKGTEKTHSDCVDLRPYCYYLYRKKVGSG